MKSIRADSLMPDSTFTEPLFLDENYILLSPDTSVDEALIERLKKWNYENLFTNGVAVGKTEIADSSDHKTIELTLDEDIKQKSDQEQITRFYFDFLSFTKDFFISYMNRNELNMGSLTEKVKTVIEQVKKHRDFILRFNEMKYPTDNYLYNHSVNSTLLALAIGSILKLPPHKLIELGIAAVLHDIGMLRIPPNLYMTNKPLTPVEKKTIMAHTIAGYKSLKTHAVHETLALPALEHHERLDGSGYPRAMKGEQISLYSRIIAIACTFDGITADRPYKDCMDGHHGLIDLLKNHKGRYDETVLKALIFSISLYPVGTHVLLSNNAKAIVVKTNPQNPKCPIVKILVDKTGKQMSEQVLVQTSEESGITVFRALEEAEKPKTETQHPHE
ncbi:MAG: HD-GYP domain-containing protein [Spirochaetales bacterium]|nr:HD-GYP domain-containing protein [Spirochaetales bacterium]